MKQEQSNQPSPVQSTGDNTYSPPTKIWNIMFINVVLVNIAMNFGQFMMNTLIPKFADHLGATATMVGVISGLFTVTALAIKPVAGPAIDTFPKKKLLCGAILTIMVAFITYSSAHSVTTIIIARLIHGLGMGFTATTCLALASDALPNDKLTQGISYFTLGQAIVSAVGPSIGLSLADHFGYNASFAIGAVIMGAAAVLAFFMKTPNIKSNRKFKISLNNMFAVEAAVPAGLQFFLAMAFSSVGSFLVLYAQNERGIANIGIYFTVSAICMLITRPVIGKLADKFGIHKVLLPAFFMFGLFLLVVSFADSLPMFILAAVISACGYGGASPTIQALCMKSVTPDRRGVAGTTSYIGTDLGFLTGPIIAGLLVTSLGYSAMYRLMIIPIAMACIVFIIFYQRIKAISEK